MRNISFGLLAATFLSSAAVAADMPVKAVAVPPPVVTWTGFYLGLNGGYSIGTASYNQTAAFSSTALGANGLLSSTGHNSMTGAIFGGQLGYNWQGASPWLIGLEADWQWSDQRGNNSYCTPAANTVGFFGAGANGFGYCLANQEKLQDFGTVRLRGGAVVHDTLWYLTGGGAWGTVRDSYAFTSSANPTIFPPGTFGGLGPFGAAAGAFSSTRWGWTAGGGVETKIYGNWTVKFEYLHVDLGNVTDIVGLSANPAFGAAFTTGFTGATTTRTHITDDIVRVGLNYQFNQLGYR